MVLKITHLSEVPKYLGVLYFYSLNLATLERGPLAVELRALDKELNTWQVEAVPA